MFFFLIVVCSFRYNFTTILRPILGAWQRPRKQTWSAITIVISKWYSTIQLLQIHRNTGRCTT